MRVLIAVDGSDGSFEAAGQVAPLLRDDRDQLALYCRPPQVSTRSKGVGKDVLSGATEALAYAIFAETRKRLGPQLENKASAMVGHQDPRRGIIVAAKQWSADLIVVGARGLGTFERLLLGSVSRAVVHASEIPVWVARPRSHDAHTGLRVLLASESPETARRPIELLEKFAWPAGTSFAVLTAISSIFAGRVPAWLEQQARSPDVEVMVKAWVREHDQEMQENQARMKDLLESLSPPLKGARALVQEGEPARLILAAAASENSDVVVVGTRQKWSLGNAILGSVSEAVLNHAGCSVLVVPHLESV